MDNMIIMLLLIILANQTKSNYVTLIFLFFSLVFLLFGSVELLGEYRATHSS